MFYLSFLFSCLEQGNGKEEEEQETSARSSTSTSTGTPESSSSSNPPTTPKSTNNTNNRHESRGSQTEGKNGNLGKKAEVGNDEERPPHQPLPTNPFPSTSSSSPNKTLLSKVKELGSKKRLRKFSFSSSSTKSSNGKNSGREDDLHTTSTVPGIEEREMEDGNQGKLI